MTTIKLMDIQEFPNKSGNEKRTKAWGELERYMDHLVKHPSAVFPFLVTEDELKTLYARYADPLQAVFRALKRNPQLREKKLGVRTVTKERKRGERAEIDLIGISRSFWEEKDRKLDE